jgi:hypothetical protein
MTGVGQVRIGDQDTPTSGKVQGQRIGYGLGSRKHRMLDATVHSGGSTGSNVLQHKFGR